MNEVNKELKKYIEKNIFPKYDINNIGGHGIPHIKYVIDRCFELIKEFNLEVSSDIIYTVAAFHDIGYKENPENHEEESGKIFLNDNEIKKFFNNEEIILIKEAIEDHRASLEYEPRSIYGRIVSSADREIDVDNMLERSFLYQRDKHKNENPTLLEIIEYSYKKLTSKYGKDGYAKMYYQDEKYLNYLKDIQNLFTNKNEFIKREKSIALIININKELKKYIEENIFPEYDKNDKGHNINHIKYVIKRSMKFASTVPNINYDMVYTIASYHDIACHIDRDNHEKLSGEYLLNDKNLQRFFTEEEIKIMSEAVEDHRASLEYEPRSIYGRIVSSADRNTLIEQPFKRTFSLRITESPNCSLDEIIEESRKHLIKKFGKNGYAKVYFKDEEYEKFIKDLDIYCQNKELFKQKYIEYNNIGLNEEFLRYVFTEIRKKYPDMPDKELIKNIYLKINTDKSFEEVKPLILKANNLNDIEEATLKRKK